MLLLVGFVALLSGCGVDAASAARTAAPPRSVVRVATWNVHDLFDEVDRLEPPGDEDTVFSREEVEAKLARVGSVLARADADVVVLEEVENLALLQRLAAGPLAGRGYEAYLRDGFDPRGIDVGVLSRLPVDAYVSHLDDRDVGGAHLWSRDCVEVHVGGAARPVVVLGNHLVSRLDPAQDARRERQAARVRELADALRAEDPRRLVVVAGDLNDLAGSAALAPLLADGALVDLGGALPAEDAWTWAGGGQRERIDYLLVARGDAAAALRVEVLAGDDVFTASDHRPVLVDLWTE